MAAYIVLTLLTLLNVYVFAETEEGFVAKAVVEMIMKLSKPQFCCNTVTVLFGARQGKELLRMTIESFTRGQEVHLRGCPSVSHDVMFKPKGGAPPVLQLMNKDNEILEEIPLEKFSRQECNDLLVKLGFYKKSSNEEVVTDEQKAAFSYKTQAQVNSEASPEGEKIEL